MREVNREGQRKGREDDRRAAGGNRKGGMRDMDRGRKRQKA